ncbi:MAG: CHASE domain-containing protein [Desulfobacterales bacterium]|nr:CHASE domain-containing protein [Desulfobacterales bacterium]
MHRKTDRSEVQSSWLSPAVITTLFIGTVLSVTTYFISKNIERHDMAEMFRSAMKVKTISIRRELELNSQVLDDLKGLFKASTFVSRQEFKTFTTSILDRRPEIKALEWIPWVPLSRKGEFIKKAQQDGYTDFKFTRKNTTGGLTAQNNENKPFYFPVFYLEPLQGNEAAFGFDLASNPARYAALRKAWESGQKTATRKISLVQAQKKQNGILIFIPVYNDDPGDSDQRLKTLKGFVLGVYQISDIIDTAIEYVKADEITEGLHLLVTDISSSSPELLYGQDNEGMARKSRITYSETFNVADRKWEITGWPAETFIQSHEHWTPLITGTSIFLFTLLVSFSIRQRTAELQVTRSRSRAIIENVINGIITIDRYGKVERFNPAAERIFQYRDGEVIGRNVKMLMSEQDRPHHDTYLVNYLLTGNKRIIGTGREVVGKRKNGELFPMELAVSEMRVDNERKFIGIITDITERKKAEQALVDAKEKAIEANRLKSEFLNVMSHELRTPLTVMLGNLPLLTDPDDLPDPDEIKEIADDIESSGQHLLTLINDLLDISKIEAGKMQLNRERLKTPDIVEDSVSAIQAMADQKGIAIEKQIGDIELFADPVRIKQVMINILGNALKFTEQGRISIHVTREDQGVLFSIADTGCGMNEEDLAHIFEKFKQVDSSATRAAGGTGLGLAITEKLVTLHGGTITAESRINKGSTFRILIPHAERADE